ncbi:MAG TPA: C1 family peptidase [Bacteroidales bacterium]|nr:C1 family peptidase [Bacteroidales bacterium]
MRKITFLFLLIPVISGFSQETIKAKYQPYRPGFGQEIRASLQETEEVRPGNVFVADIANMEFPTDTSDYNSYWHFPPLSQGATGTCWCFATISFLESEIMRTSGRQVKLSEMYIVYWEYVERARAFVEQRGDVYFAQGSEAVSVPRIMKKYGIVPAEEYPGKPDGQKYHDHSRMVKEMEGYLKSVAGQNAWNTVMVVSTIRDILNRYMGEPPQKFEFSGDHYTPVTFMQKIASIKPDDYFSFISTMSATYDQKTELVEPDNWWHCDDYYNLDLKDFMQVIDDALDSAYTVCICGDISEPGYDSWKEVGIVPEFDIPPGYINESAREMRLQNGTTTDDQCIHIIGMSDINEDRWYLIKDSGAGGFDGKNKGYRFLHEDYIRLKMMNVMVHKYAARNILDRIIK